MKTTKYLALFLVKLGYLQPKISFHFILFQDLNITPPHIYLFFNKYIFLNSQTFNSFHPIKIMILVVNILFIFFILLRLRFWRPNIYIGIYMVQTCEYIFYPILVYFCACQKKKCLCSFKRHESFVINFSNVFNCTMKC